MRTRILLTALAACGLWTAAAPAQMRFPVVVARPPMLAPPATMNMTRPGILPTPPPHTVFPAVAFPPIQLPPVQIPPFGTTSPFVSPFVAGAVGVSAGTISVTPSTATATGSASAPATAGVATAPPDLTRLEAEAALAIPAPKVPAGESDEAMRVAQAAVKVERAQRVLDMLTPARPVTLTAFDFATIRVGARGWIDMTAQVLRLADQIAVLRLNAPIPEGMEIGVTGGPAPGEKVRLHGEYVADRVVNVDGRDILVLRRAGADRADPSLAQVVSAARFRLESAQTEYTDAVAALATAKKKAVDTALDRASIEAAKRIQVPDNAAGEERIKAKRDQDDLARKIAQPEIEWINAAYGDVPTNTGLVRR
jgi:hypothetical protein